MDPVRRVLVVEDEPALADLARMYLERDGFVVDVAGDVAGAQLAARRNPPNVVLLDIGLPGGRDGVDLCREMRAAGDWTPVILVTARDDEVDRVLGLELGADDYVTKPYSPRELVARVKAVLRRGPGGTATVVVSEEPPLQVGRVRLDAGRREVFADDQPVDLTATEFDLLAHLMRRPGRVFGRGELLSQVWDYPPDDATRTVDVHVAQVRAKLGDASPIRTVRGVGYAADDRRA
ncbi:response regulator transcription factor [Angustibacter luteus]|uniref:Response regulator transcription factor n=1 Tax=Angustibacter luteus TaxID=658456 RepID=A0ABW1J9S3_9ACTN